MKRCARIALFFLLVSGLWLALKPTMASRRMTFLPQHWSEYLDLMDFWLNLGSFAILGAAVWLAFGTLEQVLRRLCVMAGVITLLNTALEVMQSRIPGRAVDVADVWAGLLGCVLGLAGGLLVEVWQVRRKPRGTAPRVLFLDQTGCLGGAELMLLDIAAARAADSEVVLFQDGEFRTALEKAGVRTTVLHLGAEAAGVDKQAGVCAALGCLPALADLLLQTAHKAREFDVVYANTAKALIIGGPAALLARRRLVFHLHDIIADGHFSMLNQQALVQCANFCATAVIANSEATRAAFIAAGGHAELCTVVPNGFRIPEARSSAGAQRALRTALDLPPRAWTVLMAGRLAPWKGQHVLLEALQAVPEAHAVLLGEALFTDEDRRYAQMLHTRAAQPDLAGRIHFAGFQKDTLPYFDLADAVVHASVHPEPFGRVIVEGMLAGRPVIAARAGGAAEIVQHEKTGLLVTPGDAPELAAALRRVKNDPAFAAGLAQHARQTAQDTYALGAVQAQIESIIRRAAGCRHAQEPQAGAAAPMPQTA